MDSMTGIEMIQAELKEARVNHGFTVEYDRISNRQGELLQAAIYLLTSDETWFPIDWDIAWKTKFDRKTVKERITIAGVFMACELDRLNAIENEESEAKEDQERRDNE